MTTKRIIRIVSEETGISQAEMCALPKRTLGSIRLRRRGQEQCDATNLAVAIIWTLKPDRHRNAAATCLGFSRDSASQMRQSCESAMRSKPKFAAIAKRVIDRINKEATTQ